MSNREMLRATKSEYEAGRPGMEEKVPSSAEDSLREGGGVKDESEKTLDAGT
jgi:hypothetical protein